MNQPLTVIYVSWGDDDIYHTGVLFNWLRLVGLGYAKGVTNAVVYTDHPEYYADYPLQTRTINADELAQWSLNGQYFFRIKAKTLAEAVHQFGGKVLHIDSDILIERPLIELFNFVTPKQSIFALNEGRVCSEYDAILNAEHDDFLRYYSDLKQVNMYGSAILGVSHEMKEAVDAADELILKWIPQTKAHTIEQFSISEALIRSGVSLKDLPGSYDDFNSKGKKAYAKLRIRDFFNATQGLSFEDKANAAAKWRVQRTPWVWLKQKLKIGS
jgi:hypothetical protein